MSIKVICVPKRLVKSFNLKYPFLYDTKKPKDKIKNFQASYQFKIN